MWEFLHKAFYIKLFTILVHFSSFGKDIVTLEELNWIEIADAATLAKIGSKGFPLDGNYLQTQDIDLSEFSANEGWKRIGNSESLPFNGIFDGQGYTISNLSINRDESFQGLFGHVGAKAILKEIRLTNVSIQTTTSKFYNGVLIGQNKGHVINCAVIDGELSVGRYSGGLVGYNTNTGKIEQSYSGINVTGGDRMGGLIGVNFGGQIINSYAQGSVTGENDIGGLVGWNRQFGYINNCYSSGQVHGEKNVGGLIGLNEGEVKNTYWNIETSNQSNSAGKEEGKSDAEMKLKSTFIDWDFDNIWHIKEGENAPILKYLAEVNIEVEKEIPVLTFILNGFLIDPENIINCTYGDVLNFHVESTSDGDLSDLKFELLDPPLLDISLLSAIKVTKVGSTILKVIQPETDLYDFKEVYLKIVIAKKTLLITSEVGQYKIYGDVDPKLNFRVVNGHLSEGDSFEGALERENGEDAGFYTISNGTLNAGPNYALVFEDGQFIIKQADSKISAETNQVHVYDGTAKVITAGLNHDETELIIEPVEPFINAGVYELEIYSKETRNFLEGSKKVTLTIEKAVLTVTANNHTSTYGDNNPIFTFNYQGFKGEDDENILIDLPKVNTMTATIIDIGEYTIIPFGAKADNYSFKYINGLLTVIPANFENIILEDQSFVYKGQPHSLKVNTVSEDITVVYENNEHVNAGVYEVKATFSKRGHVSQVLNARLTITKAPQMISFEEIGNVSRDIGQIKLNAKSNMGMPVRFFSDDNLVATLNGDNLLVHRLGIVKVTAIQDGDGNHEAALPVTIQVQVEDRAEGPVRVHQALSPNGDGINDFLIIEGIKEFPENRLQIINPTGMVVFDIEGYDNETKVFNGTTNKQASQLNLSDGTYFYVLRYKKNKIWQSKKGWIQLKSN